MKMLDQVKNAAIDAAWLLGGEAVNNRIQGVLPASVTASMGVTGQAALEAVTGLILAFGADRFVSRNAGKMVAAGTLAAALKKAIVASSPTAATWLSGYPQSLAGYPEGLSGPALLSPGAITGFHRGLGNAAESFDYDGLMQ